MLIRQYQIYRLSTRRREESDFIFPNLLLEHFCTINGYYYFLYTGEFTNSDFELVELTDDVSNLLLSNSNLPSDKINYIRTDEAVIQILSDQIINENNLLLSQGILIGNNRFSCTEETLNRISRILTNFSLNIISGNTRIDTMNRGRILVNVTQLTEIYISINTYYENIQQQIIDQIEAISNI